MLSERRDGDEGYEAFVIGVKKRELLKDVLAVLKENLSQQRLWNEIREMLQATGEL